MKNLLFGVAYYPEQDPEEDWAVDARLMKDLGLNCIRIGEFCWSRLQSRDGTFHLDWLERVIQTFHEHGIQTILCTPTATPPVWIVERYPDLACLTPDGREGLFGGRRHYSVFHEAYRAHCREIAEALAVRFGGNPAVIGWQIDNEVGSYSSIDCSEPALKGFHRYIENKHSTVEGLNKNWGLIFWNQEVERFDQVPAPHEMMCTRNPSYILDYNRFCIEGMAEFLLEQAVAIRKHAVDQFIVASGIEEVQRALGRLQDTRNIQAVDEISMHNYPEIFARPGELAMMFDRHRALSKDGRFRVLEQQSGSGATTTNGLDPMIRRYWTFEALAHGAKSICWFQWRRFRTGCEWRLPCIIERDRRPRSAYFSVKQIIRECRAIEDILSNAKIVGDVQILVSTDNILARDRSSEKTFWMELQLPSGIEKRFPLWESEILRSIYNPLCHLGLTVDFVSESSDWDLMKPLLIPDLDICTDEIRQKLEEWCYQGGTVVCYPGAGERDEFGAQRNLCPPGILSPLFGVELADYWPQGSWCDTVFDPAAGQMKGQNSSEEGSSTCMIRLGGADLSFDARHAEVLEPKNALVIGHYLQDPHRGQAAITQRKVGNGKAVYMGAVPSDEKNAIRFWQSLLEISTPAEERFRTIKLRAGKSGYRFLLNKGPAPCGLAHAVTDLISGKTMDLLPAWGVALVSD